MKSFLTPAYTFVPDTAGIGTVDLGAIENFDIKRLVAIINQTMGVTIYATSSLTKGYSNLSGGGSTVWLAFDTSTMDSADMLQIIYEDMGTKDNANSSPVTLATEQENMLSNIQQYTGDMITKMSAGQDVSASSLAVALSVEQEIIIMDMADAIGDPSDTAAPAVGTYSLIAHIKLLITSLLALSAKFGSIGQHAAANSLSTVNCTEDAAAIGIVTETAPATDTASSGLNGRLQRIAQRITSLIALLPGSLGQKTMANSLAVTIASDQTAPAFNSVTKVVLAANTTSNMPAGAKWMIIQNSLEAASPLRFTEALTTPTTATGFYLSPGQSTALMPAGNVKTISFDGGAIDCCILWFV